MDNNFVLAAPIAYKLLRENAVFNRRHPTDAERMVWEFLKTSPCGVRFRNQYVIGQYIVDFVALKGKVIIEIDGGYHLEEAQRRKDEEREKWLRTLGFRIVRFSNEEVYNNMDKIKETIKAELY